VLAGEVRRKDMAPRERMKEKSLIVGEDPAKENRKK